MRRCRRPASRGHHVRLHSRSPERLVPIIERGELEKRGAAGEEFVKIPETTTDLAQATTGADPVMITVPISSYPFYAHKHAPLLAPDQIVFLNPGHMGGGLFMAHELQRLTDRADIRTCETSTLTYACRMKGPAVVNITSTMTNLPFAAFSGRHQREIPHPSDLL